MQFLSKENLLITAANTSSLYPMRFSDFACSLANKHCVIIIALPRLVSIHCGVLFLLILPFRMTILRLANSSNGEEGMEEG